jgi:CBS domain containing-hemolysin-like protein
MTTKDSDSREGPGAKAPEPKQGGQLVERMFSGFAHANDARPEHPKPPSEEPYRPLRQSKAKPGATYRFRSHAPAPRVQASSPAREVMTDLSQVAAVTTTPGASIDEAQKLMIARGVRALFVVDETRAVLGIVTADDILGEKPVQIAQDRGARHADVLVRDVMTPADLLEAMEFGDVLQARVGDVVETLKRSGRHHALVIEPGAADATSTTHTVRGIFSLTQIARQLGLPPQPGHDVARTFAEIEAAIGA